MTKPARGFTLIELMIVVTVIGILATMAMVKFVDLITRTREASTKGSLGTLRSAVSIYYAEMEGLYPGNNSAPNTDLTGADETFADAGPFLTKFIEHMPLCKTGVAGHSNYTSNIYASTAPYIKFCLEEGDLAAIGCGCWYYSSENGKVLVGCSHTDVFGITIGAW